MYQVGGNTNMETKTIYVNEIDSLWSVWLNTNHPSCSAHNPPHLLGTQFESFGDAATFAQAWADGIVAKDGIECEVILNIALSKDSAPRPDADAIAFTAAQDFVSALMPLIQLSKVIDGTIVFKRLYLGSTYAYNILSKHKFLAKSPKTVSGIISIFMWLFMHLPKWLILRWPSPELRD